MGTFVHENGHLVCGWPDFYSYDDHHDNNAESYNIGDAFQIQDYKNPSYPNPWALDQVGWLFHKEDITNYRNGKIVTLQRGVGHAAVFYGSGANANERYYLEIRDKHFKKSWGNTNNGKGIFIWHSNEKGDNTTKDEPELLDCRPATDNNPFWCADNGPDFFSDNSNPSAKWYNGNDSEIYLCDFSSYGETMTFRCGLKPNDPLIILPSTIPNASIGNPYVLSFELVGGDENYSISIVNGSLPSGLTLTVDSIFGYPTELGDYNFTIQVTDGSGKSVQQNLTIRVIESSPLSEEILVIPGTIEMEQFDLGGQNVAYNDVDSVNEGDWVRADEASVYIQDIKNLFGFSSEGISIMHNEKGEWTQYTVEVKNSSLYQFCCTYASQVGSRITLFFDGDSVASLSFEGKSNVDYSRSRGYSEKCGEVYLTEGVHKLRYYISDLSGGGLYMDKITFTAVNSSNMLSLENSEEGVGWTITQNTTSSQIQIESREKLDRVEVYASNGLLVDCLTPNSCYFSFGADYPVGLYIVKVTTQTGSSIQKIVKRPY